MTKLTRVSILFAVLLGLYFLQSPRHELNAQSKGAAAPAFTLELLDGGTLRTSDLKGKVQVLKFVASY